MERNVRAKLKINFIDIPLSNGKRLLGYSGDDLEIPEEDFERLRMFFYDSDIKYIVKRRDKMLKGTAYVKSRRS